VDEVGSHNDVTFPEYTEGWFGAAQIDPESDLVQRRKSDLQAFFFELFRNFPILFHHYKVIEFLEVRKHKSVCESTDQIFSTFLFS
jgi:hypothetical protein